MKDAVEVSRGSTKEGTHGRDRLITIYAERSTAPAVGPMSSSKSGLLLSKTASTVTGPGRGPSDSASRYRAPQAGRPPQAPWGWQRGRERKMRRSSGSLSGQILGL